MLKKKIKSRVAFTLAETLVAVIIMLMVSSILVTGIPAAKNAYEKVFVKSDAEVLMSTCIYSLRNEMAGARNVSVGDDEKTVKYLNASYGSRSKIYIDKDSNDVHGNTNVDRIMYIRYSYVGDSAPVSGVRSEEEPEPLVSGAAEDKLTITYTKAVLNEEDGYITFEGLTVKDFKGKTVLGPRALSITVF